MNILHLWDGRRRKAKRLQIDFIKKLSMFDDLNLYIYGPSEHTINGENISPLKYNEKLDVRSIIDELDIDIVLLPEQDIIKYMGNIELCPVPKLMIETDFYTTPANWYKEKKIDLVITRSPAINFGVPSVYLPFSANEDEFYTDPDTAYLNGRRHEIVFVGAGLDSNNVLYKVRQNAVTTLYNNNMLQLRGDVGSILYPRVLKDSTIALSCSFPPLYSLPAKGWEIMASGTALFTSSFRAKEILFGKKPVCFFYDEDCSDIIEQAKLILHKDNSQYIEYITRNALEVINNKHLDKHRIKELYDIIKAFYYGKEIPQVWKLD